MVEVDLKNKKMDEKVIVDRGVWDEFWIFLYRTYLSADVVCAKHFLDKESAAGLWKICGKWKQSAAVFWENRRDTGMLSGSYIFGL